MRKSKICFHFNLSFLMFIFGVSCNCGKPGFGVLLRFGNDDCDDDAQVPLKQSHADTTLAAKSLISFTGGLWRTKTARWSGGTRQSHSLVSPQVSTSLLSFYLPGLINHSVGQGKLFQVNFLQTVQVVAAEPETKEVCSSVLTKLTFLGGILEPFLWTSATGNAAHVK